MDILTTIEPQLAIPVVGVVLCALLVYIFGFQKTQEPSFQHLALLQSTSKGSRASNASLRQRSSTPQVKASSKTKATVANGHAVQEKASPKPNGTAKSPKVTRDPSNKENVRPQQQQKLTPKKVKISKDAADDLESGDWIQAPSRKDRKSQDKKSKKENTVVATIKPTKEAITEESDSEKPVTVLRDVTPTKIQSSPPPAVKQPEEETAITEEAAPVPVQTTPKKSKETKKKAEKATVAEVDTSPKKTENKVENKVVAPVNVTEKVTLISTTTTTTTTSSLEEDSEISKENASPVAAAPPVKAIPTKVVEESNSSDPRNNIAFDEMGDTWEEAKSARAKKRRARKD